MYNFESKELKDLFFRKINDSNKNKCTCSDSRIKVTDPEGRGPTCRGRALPPACAKQASIFVRELHLARGWGFKSRKDPYLTLPAPTHAGNKTNPLSDLSLRPGL